MLSLEPKIAHLSASALLIEESRRLALSMIALKIDQARAFVRISSGVMAYVGVAKKGVKRLSKDKSGIAANTSARRLMLENRLRQINITAISIRPIAVIDNT